MKNLDKNISLKMIEELSNAFGAPGFEEDVVKIGIKYAEKFSSYRYDGLKNLILDWKGNSKKSKTIKKPIILLDSHSDEVGFMVQSILENGLIKFLPLGGWLAQHLPAHSVLIRNSENEIIKGIISTKPPHFMTTEEKKGSVDLDNMMIDIGSSSYEETINLFKIEVGNPIVPDVKFSFNTKNNIMSGKAFDNRLGCAALIDTMKILDDTAGKNKKIKFDVIGGLSSQEETGTRGIEVTVKSVKPDLAIVFEGTPADDTFFRSKYETQGALRKGPQIRHLDNGMVANSKFIKFAKNIAKKEKIIFQEAVRKGGFTNGKIINLSSDFGVPTLVIGVPDRYAHTHNNYSSYDDYENSVKLAAKIIENLTLEIINSFSEI